MQNGGYRTKIIIALDVLMRVALNFLLSILYLPRKIRKKVQGKKFCSQQNSDAWNNLSTSLPKLDEYVAPNFWFDAAKKQFFGS